MFQVAVVFVELAAAGNVLVMVNMLSKLKFTVAFIASVPILVAVSVMVDGKPGRTFAPEMVMRKSYAVTVVPKPKSFRESIMLPEGKDAAWLEGVK